MPQKNKSNDGYKAFVDALKAETIDCLYILHGEERYLLQHSLTRLRSLLCPNGLNGFNYKRYEGKVLTLDTLDEAIDTLPTFASRTLIEIHDFDIFKCNDADKKRLGRTFSQLPEYVCVLFVYNAVDYKPDRRVKTNTEILKYANVVEFPVQEQGALTKWIAKHFADAGKRISSDNARYLALITGGYMSTLLGEIEKTAAFTRSDVVERADIDAVVTPVLDTVVYKMTDAIAKSEHALAMKIMDELLRMKEPAHKLLFSISLTMRQLMAARVCIESNHHVKDLMHMCGIRFDFQAKALMDTVRTMSLKSCCEAVLHCSDTALALNSSSEPEACLTELILKLAF
ncbi:MAG: DNA polymerase III subunit delta [Oscillospiraceae bacterium]|nr:DNA polymerase III subunit delta [Oscillospiraceae bacterium]